MGDANTASRGTVPRPIGGTYLKHAFNVIIYLREHSQLQTYKATLVKHQYSKTPKSAILKTTKICYCLMGPNEQRDMDYM